MPTDIEYVSPAERRGLQDERLRDTVEHAYENVPFYREAMDDAGVHPDDVDGVADIDKLPTTTKEDFRDTYPDGLFAVPREDVARVHASSGTTGKPKIVGYTESDLDVWAEVADRSLRAAGVTDTDTVQNAYGYGLFTGGLGIHMGAERLGAELIPIGGGNTDRQLDFLEDLGSDVLTCTPSYALYLAERAADRGVALSDLPLSTVVFGAEPCTDPMRDAIEERLDVDGVDIYGLSEIIGPGVAVECVEAKDGLHVWDDRFYPEVVDPDTGEVLPEGEEGELVLTTLSKEALPVLRYRTGDMTTLTSGECDCGRTTVRMDNVTGRTDDLLIVRGVNCYPSEIEAVALDTEGVAPHYRIDLRRDGELDRIEITVERADDFDGDPEALHDTLLSRLSSVLSFTPDDLTVAPPGGIDRQATGKVKRVFDHR
ncbi:phenylacetate--CoA ligase PaaK [Halobacterium litoreum]|uniref:Phenylacetate--CoA ligase PaaK n=1 Tax=Halobacterium litoreum TaxID=2039234 RepID=A0ABD5NHV4_9EURY|nr:phenylacetate--CoA ligase PaaK [Halobacterium litoreum]UHH12279.1 phenylacetate--CoA ligase [Halobacterium litoreum]